MGIFSFFSGINSKKIIVFRQLTGIKMKLPITFSEFIPVSLKSTPRIMDFIVTKTEKTIINPELLGVKSKNTPEKSDFTTINLKLAIGESEKMGNFSTFSFAKFPSLTPFSFMTTAKNLPLRGQKPKIYPSGAKNQGLTILFLLICLLTSSCVKYPQLLYFRNQEAFVPLQNHNITNEVQIKIQPDDALLIMVRALDQETAEPFNLFPSSTSLANIGNASSNTTLQGYLVDANGNIDVPVLGRVKVSDLTIEETKEMLVTKLKPFLNEPVILIRFLNFRFTVLGEVKSPRTISVPGERITILEALGQAGDLTPYSNREKIMVIREQDGKREFGYINIHSPEIFQSPYFYLQQNDIVYVEPIKEATAIVRDPISETLPIISSILSIGAILIALLR